MSWFNPPRTVSVAAVGLALSTSALAQSQPARPGVDALDEFRKGRAEPQAIENRFFIKEKRFEISPHVGYVPNNSFARRYVGGAVLNYHFNEKFAIGTDITYSPDLGKDDLKQLVGVLLDRAFNASGANVDFRQPLDKVTLSATFGLTYAPIYGKINLIGETVLNFDFYGYAGLGMVSKTNYFATYDPNVPPELIRAPNDVVTLAGGDNEVKVSPTLGIGQNYFFSQLMALKIDVKASLFLDNKPSYVEGEVNNEQRLYNNFVASAGFGFYFPKMKPRLYDF